MRHLILLVFYSAGTNFCRSRSIRKIRKNKNPQNFHATRYFIHTLEPLLERVYLVHMLALQAPVVLAAIRQLILLAPKNSDRPEFSQT